MHFCYSMKKFFDSIFALANRFFDILPNPAKAVCILVFFALIAFVVLSLTSCSGIYHLNKAIAYEIRYDRDKVVNSNLSVKMSNMDEIP